MAANGWRVESWWTAVVSLSANGGSRPLRGQQQLLADGSGRYLGGRWRPDGSRSLGGQLQHSTDGGGQTVAAIDAWWWLASLRAAAVSTDDGGSWRTVEICLSTDSGVQMAVGQQWLSADGGGWLLSQRSGGGRMAVGL